MYKYYYSTCASTEAIFPAIDKRELFILLKLGVNDIKSCFLSLMLSISRLECLFPPSKCLETLTLNVDVTLLIMLQAYKLIGLSLSSVVKK